MRLPVLRGGRRGVSLSEQQMQLVLALPGIGPVTARALCARFRSLHDLLTADAATMAMIPGVSPARAAALEQLLRAALPTSGDGDGSIPGEKPLRGDVNVVKIVGGPKRPLKNTPEGAKERLPISEIEPES